MNSKPDIIVASTASPVYLQDKSRWFGKARGDKLRIVFSFYSPDGNEISMPFASMSAYLKRDFPWVEVLLKPILMLRDAEEYSPDRFTESIRDAEADLIAFSIMSPHWYPMEPYLEMLKANIQRR